MGEPDPRDVAGRPRASDSVFLAAGVGGFAGLFLGEFGLYLWARSWWHGANGYSGFLSGGGIFIAGFAAPIGAMIGAALGAAIVAAVQWFRSPVLEGRP